LRQIQALAESHPEWLRPRWSTRVQVWRELLLAAAAGEAARLERARLRGFPLLAAEVRLASMANTARSVPSAAGIDAARRTTGSSVDSAIGRRVQLTPQLPMPRDAAR